ncbi:unnamed protein product [Closterium sp. NIES-54]
MPYWKVMLVIVLPALILAIITLCVVVWCVRRRPWEKAGKGAAKLVGSWKGKGEKGRGGRRGGRGGGREGGRGAGEGEGDGAGEGWMEGGAERIGWERGGRSGQQEGREERDEGRARGRGGVGRAGRGGEREVGEEREEVQEWGGGEGDDDHYTPLASGAERQWAGGGVVAGGAAGAGAGFAIGARLAAVGAFAERGAGGGAGAGGLGGAGGAGGGGGGVAASRGKGALREGSSRGASMQTLAPFAEATFSFSLTEIHTATGGFHPSNLIGRGGSSQVFRGCLPGGKLVAVKRFDSLPGAERDFITEARLLSRLNHKNVVKLLGTCDEGGVRCLVFQLAEKGSLREHLHSSTLPTSSLHPPTLPSSHSALSPAPAVLDWTTRLKIALGAAQGLAYLHEDSSPQIIHRDLKTSNILLDSDWTARIADLGLARVVREKVGGGGRGVGGRGGGKGEVGEEGEKGEEGEEGAEAREAKQGEENQVGDNEDGGNQRIIIGAEEGARGRGEGEKVGLESQHMRGTFGYMAPEYTLTGRVATKSDVFSFGVVLLEVLSGRPALVPLEQTQQILEAPQASSARPALVSLESTQTAGDAAAAAVEESAAVVNGADGAVKAVATAGEESAANTSVLEGACAAAAAGGNGGPRPGVLSIVVWATPLLSSYVHAA